MCQQLLILCFHISTVSANDEGYDIMKPTTNVEFIATYIFHHPGARHIDIMRELRKWRRIDETYSSSKWVNGELEPCIAQQLLEPSDQLRF